MKGCVRTAIHFVLAARCIQSTTLIVDSQLICLAVQYLVVEVEFFFLFKMPHLGELSLATEANMLVSLHSIWYFQTMRKPKEE
jgi:hypothetical protein